LLGRNVVERVVEVLKVINIVHFLVREKEVAGEDRDRKEKHEQETREDMERLRD
jgi:hypothetical protein